MDPASWQRLALRDVSGARGGPNKLLEACQTNFEGQELAVERHRRQPAVSCSRSRISPVHLDGGRGPKLFTWVPMYSPKFDQVHDATEFPTVSSVRLLSSFRTSGVISYVPLTTKANISHLAWITAIHGHHQFRRRRGARCWAQPHLAR